MRTRLSRALGLLLLLLGCAPREPSAEAPRGAAATPPSQGLSFDVRAPASAPYDARSLGPSGRFVEVHVRNEGERVVPVAGLDVTFSTSRGGVVFPCSARSASGLDQRLPATLAPGASLELERELGCTMPLPGVYQVEVFVHTEAAPAARRVGAFKLELLAGANVPRPLGEAGLFGLITGSRATPPLTPKAWTEGDYHVVLALINDSKRTIPLGPAKLSFVVYKKGSPYPCTSEAKPLSLPEQLASGAVYTAQLPISCAPSEEGQYEVSGRFSMNGSEEIEIGRLGLHVTSNPLLFTPLPPL
jgi:hypothetical protein